MLLTDAAKRERFRASYRAAAGIAMQPPPVAARLDAVLDTLDSERFPGAILPRASAEGLSYYAVVETLPAWRRLMPLLRAFAGVTLTDFAGQLTELRPEDPVEGLLASHGFQAVARFGTGSSGTAGGDDGGKRAGIALAAIERLRECVERSDPPRRPQPRTTGEVLQRFRMALATLDRRLAEEQIAFLRANLRLDALNLHFLEVQLDAAFGDWPGLIQRPFFDALVLTRRPARVTAALVEALYRTAIAPAEAEGGAPDALRRFRSDVAPRAGTLFTVLPHDPAPAVGKAFLLAELDAHNGAVPDGGRVEELKRAATHWPPDEAAFFHRLLDLVAPAPAAPEALSAEGRGPAAAPPAAAPAAPEADYARELEAARDDAIPATPARARAVLVAAAEVATLDGYRTAVDYVERLSAAEQVALKRAPGFGALWNDVARFAAQGKVPRDWLEWLDLLPEMDFAQSRAWAEQAVDEWPVERQLRGPEDVRRLTAKINDVPPAYQDLLLDALPQLVAWIQSDPGWPDARLRPLYAELLGLLLLGSSRSANVRESISILLGGLLSLGTSPTEYGAALDGLRDFLQQVAGTSTAGWALDTVELTVAHGCPDQDARARLWAAAAGLLQPLAQRLTAAQRSVLFELGALLGVPEGLAAPEPPPAQVAAASASRVLRNFRVAVYTLTDGVGQNVRNALARLYPMVRVDLLDDHVNSTRLQDLAQTADLFVVFKRSAKHAATNAIQQHRPRNRPTIHAIGKGSSSVLDEIDRHLRGLVGDETGASAA